MLELASVGSVGARRGVRESTGRRGRRANGVRSKYRRTNRPAHASRVRVVVRQAGGLSREGARERRAPASPVAALPPRSVTLWARGCWCSRVWPSGLPVRAPPHRQHVSPPCAVRGSGGDPSCRRRVPSALPGRCTATQEPHALLSRLAAVRSTVSTVWTHAGSALLEFPPVMYGKRIFQLGDDAVIHAIDKYTGLNLWSDAWALCRPRFPPCHPARCMPRCSSRCPEWKRPGRRDEQRQRTHPLVAAICRAAASPLPCSPRQAVFRHRKRHGLRVERKHRTHPVDISRRRRREGQPDLSNGVLYFGDYSGELQAVRESDGQRLWESGSGGALWERHVLLDPRSRSTAACSSATQTGASTLMTPPGQTGLGGADRRLRLRLPRRHERAGLGPTIYLGSYDGTFYAINARCGRIDWTYKAGGRISGSATIVGASCISPTSAAHRTIGLGDPPEKSCSR